MDDKIKKHIKLYKFILLPWGIFTTTPVWYAMVKALDWLLGEIDCITFPWWARIAVFAIGELLIILGLMIYPRILPKGKKTKRNFYVLIYPDSIDDDEYITKDFVDNLFERSSRIDNLQIITPGYVKRRAFVKRVEKQKKRGRNYFESRRWKKLHKKLHGSMYVQGELIRRKSNNREKLVFKLSATIGYNNWNQNLESVFINEMKINFPSKVTIDKGFELEQFELFSDLFTTHIEYLLGWACLVSGDLLHALEMHSDILKNNRGAFYKNGYLRDLEKLIRYESLSILNDYKNFSKDFLSTCSSELTRLFPDDPVVSISVARVLVLTSSEKELMENVKKAHVLLNKAKVDKNTRATLYANKAYLFLLERKYAQAEIEYEKLFKKPFGTVANNIIEYCDNQVKNGTMTEKPTALYVKALILSKIPKGYYSFEDAYDDAQKQIPPSEEYYHKKLDEMKK